MWFVVVVFSELFRVAESGVVAFECLEEPFDFALRGGFSSGTEDMLYSLLGTEACESAWAVVAPVLRTMVG